MWGPPDHQESARISISEFVTIPGRKNHESSRRPSETRVENFFWIDQKSVLNRLSVRKMVQADRYGIEF